MLTKKQNLNNKLHIREDKWHQELNTVFSLDFWSGSYRLMSQLKWDNKMKWLQYNIIRSCLKTNNTVNHFMPNVSPLCTYCGLEPERILHLFVTCERVKNFWQEVHDFFIQLNFFVPLDRSKILFGIHDKPPDSIVNYILLAGKQYIWRNKFFEPLTPLSLNAFKNILKSKIKEVCEAAELVVKDDNLAERWNTLYVLL